MRAKPCAVFSSGRVPEELDEKPAFRTGQAYAVHLAPGSVAIGYDCRVSSPTLAAGFIKAGVDVIGIDFDSEIKNISRFAWERA